MQNIHVSRYTDASAGWQGSIEPEDRSWVVFVKEDGSPQLWFRVETVDGDGKRDHAYMDAETLSSVDGIKPGEPIEVESSPPPPGDPSEWRRMLSAEHADGPPCARK